MAKSKKYSQIAISNETPSPAGRIPPQAVDVEKAVLGAMLLEKEAVPKVLELLDIPVPLPNHSGKVSLFPENSRWAPMTIYETL